MEGEFTKLTIRSGLLISPTHTNVAVKGLLRGLIVGMIFSSIVAYIGVIEIGKDIEEGENSIEDISTLEQKRDNINLAAYLYDEVRVLCFVLPISKSTLEERGEIFLQTWAKRCHKFIFFADDPSDKFKEEMVVLKDKRNNWSRMREALAYIYKHHMSDFDWVLKVTDASYIVMENLRWFLYQYDSKLPLFIGQRFLKEDYMMGVYVLSRTAFIRLIEGAFTNNEICNKEGGLDADKQIALCLQHTNVLQIDGIDDEGRGMFFMNAPEPLLFPEVYDKNFDQWYWHKVSQGFENCCSERLIAIQNIANTHLLYMEYFIYKVHAFGRHKLPEKLPPKKSIEEIVMKY